MKYEKPSLPTSYSTSKAAAACLDPRHGASNVGGIVKPAGAPPPSSKGTISYPKQVGK